MLNPDHIFANNVLQLLPFFENLAVGIFGLFTILWVNMFFLRRIAIYYEINARIHIGHGRYNRVFLTYIVSITFLMLIQVLSILCWSGLILILGLAEHPFNAMLFVGSCYTTIGIVSDVMPNAWKLQAIFISLSGLFAMALSTASMLNMIPLFRQAWYRKHDRKIRQILTKNNLRLSEFDELEGITPPEKKN